MKFNRPLRQFSLVEKYFNNEEVQKVLELEKNSFYQKAKLNSDGDINSTSRNSSVFAILPNSTNTWLFRKFEFLISQVNHDAFLYDLSGFEGFQFTKYESNDFYNWHYDVLMDYNHFERKMSAIIMLSDKSEYSGGELEIIIDGNPENSQLIEMNKGDVFFFASWMPHRVKQVTSGVRKTLVSWILSDRCN